MKKLRLTVLAIVALLCLSVTSIAAPIFVEEADVPTAHSGIAFNSIMILHGFQLQDGYEYSAPTSFVKKGDQAIPIFGTTPVAYSPKGYHAIFKSYGLTLHVVDALDMPSSYCTVVNGQIIFSDTPIAYSNQGLTRIINAYSQPTEDICVDIDQDGYCDDVDKCPDTPIGAIPDEDGCWVVDQDFLFDFDKATVKSEFFPIADDIAKVLVANPTMKLVIKGHTDSKGSAKYNQRLSERRAEAVGFTLIDRNRIDASRLGLIGYGETRPKATNDTAEGRAKNRRVELSPVW